MPGLIGFLKPLGVLENEIRNHIVKACKMMVHHQSIKIDSLYSDDKIIASRVHLNVIGEENSPAEDDNIYCWIDGECYNSEQIAQEIYNKLLSSSQLLIEAYKRGEIEKVANRINGFYNAVVYDSNRGIIKLISDRLGFRPLFIWIDDRHFGWSAELKSFLSFPEFRPQIDPRAVECFLQMGYLLGDITWFQNVQLIPASTVLTYKINEGTAQQVRYWSWGEIKQQSISFDDALSQLTSLWRKAVRRCYQGVRGKIGIALSGGLDSRAILAFSHLDKHDFIFTFGNGNCDDVKLARRVCDSLHLPHTTFPLSSNNWFLGKKESVWRSDGLINLLHQHGSPFSKHLIKQLNLNLSGFIGEVILRGYYTKFPNSRITEKMARVRFGDLVKYTNIDDVFYNIYHEEPYIIDTRARRFTIYSNCDRIYENRLPFLDNELVEFAYSLKDEIRLSWVDLPRIYCQKLSRVEEMMILASSPSSKVRALSHKMYLKEYPILFGRIPWQGTGFPLRKKKNVSHTLYYILKRIIGALRGILSNWEIMNDSRYFINPKVWLKKLMKESATRELLLSPDAIYRQYIAGKQRIDKIVNEFTKTRRDTIKEILIGAIRSNCRFIAYLFNHLIQGPINHSDEICRYLTMEIWFQQVNNRFPLR